MADNAAILVLCHDTLAECAGQVTEAVTAAFTRVHASCAGQNLLGVRSNALLQQVDTLAIDPHDGRIFRVVCEDGFLADHLQ